MADITKHEGKKYLRKIYAAVQDPSLPPQFVWVDVYAVLVAFDVTCPGLQQCVKKVLMPGKRGKGDELADKVGAQAALNRSIDLEKLKLSIAADSAVEPASEEIPADGLLPEGLSYVDTSEAFFGTPLGTRAHEQCFDCDRQTAEPAECSGHVDGPSPCLRFVPKVWNEIIKAAAEGERDKPEPLDGHSIHWTGENPTKSKYIVPEGALCWKLSKRGWCASNMTGEAPTANLWYALPEGASFFKKKIPKKKPTPLSKEQVKKAMQPAPMTSIVAEPQWSEDSE